MRFAAAILLLALAAPASAAGLHSRPGSPHTLWLDWSAAETSAGDQLLAYNRVAALYAPFAVDVSTEPGQPGRTATVVLGGDRAVLNGNLGLALVNGYWLGQPVARVAADDPALVGNPWLTGNGSAHEAGHLFGLVHEDAGVMLPTATGAAWTAADVATLTARLGADPVPEPCYGLAVVGAVGVLAGRRRRKVAKAK